MERHATNQILMIKPVGFAFNAETAKNNYYQQQPHTNDEDLIQRTALSEFNQFVETLRANGISVTVFEDTISPATPDSIFPNNWVSFHENGHTIIYPMFAENRRQEKRPEIISQLVAENNFLVTKTTDLSYFEEQNQFLEGTGSLILDRPNKVLYAAISDRMHPTPLKKFCDEMGYEAVIFRALQSVGGLRLPIYHTNVMMCLGKTFAVICLDSIDDETERKTVINSLSRHKKELVTITENQVSQFAGNMLEITNEENERILVMSTSAFKSLTNNQMQKLEKHCRIVHSDISTIEKLGGGSARCMMAEIFLPHHS
ncbi:MAG: arginine deiminase-related protein [Bacteroidota bacterium]